MQIRIQFFSYYRELAGCPETTLEFPEQTELRTAAAQVFQQFPNLAPFHKSTLIAVGYDYVSPEHHLQPGDVISFFPPVQGG